MDWNINHETFHKKFDEIHLSKDVQNHNKFRWTENHVFFGKNHDIPPDPVDHNNCAVQVASVKPIKRGMRNKADLQLTEPNMFEIEQSFETSRSIFNEVD